jgi:hypothetical protein
MVTWINYKIVWQNEKEAVTVFYLILAVLLSEMSAFNSQQI